MHSADEDGVRTKEAGTEDSGNAGMPSRPWRSRLPGDAGTLLGLLAFSLCLTGWVWAVTGSLPPPRALLLLLIWPAAGLRMGRAVAAALGVTASFALPFVLGNAVLGLGLMLVKLTIPVHTPLAVWAGLGLAWLAPRLLPDRRLEQGPVWTSGGELFVVVLCLAAATAWNRHESPPTAPAGDSVLFKPWSDHFTHATFVARLLDPEPIPRIGNYECKGLPAIVYHYASYTFPAAYAAVADGSAYDSLCAIWTPFGLALLGLAGYALGRTLWGHGAGLAFVAAVLLLPDTTVLPFRNPMLAYFNLLVVGPASLYGIAVAATALAVTVDGARRGDRLGLLGAVGLGASVLAFKTHIFLAAFPLVVGYAVLACRGIGLGWRCLLLVGLALAAGVGIKLKNLYEVGPILRPSLSGGVFYFRVLAEQAMPTVCTSWFAVFRAEGGFAAHLGRAAMLLSLTTFGLYVLLYPLATVTALRRRTVQLADLIPLAAVGIYLAMALGLPENHAYGTPEELQHRPFVWAYFLVAGLSAARLAALLGARLPKRAGRLGSAACVGLLVVPAVLGGKVHLQGTNWGPEFVNVKLPRGLVACARFIRRHGPVTALVQDSDLGRDSYLLGCLAQRRSFLARPDDWERVGNRPPTSCCAELRRQLERLKQATTLADLRASLTDTGIRWYLLRPGQRVAWPAEMCAHPAFAADGYQLYDLQALVGPSARNPRGHARAELRSGSLP
jgi:hypothetical protein